MYHPIPISWYFDDSIHNIEQKCLFQSSLQYMGHELMIPKLNDYLVLERTNRSEFLIHAKQSNQVISNICRHHQALLLQGKGNTPKIICPLHHWMYNTDGKMTHSPLFEGTLCMDLHSQKTSSWNGLIFKGTDSPHIKNPKSKIQTSLDFSNYAFSHSMSQSYPINWKIFMEVFIDNYHVPFIHPGLRSFVDWKNQSWEIETGYSAQFVGIQENWVKKSINQYHNYAQLLAEYLEGELPPIGALWFAYYPNLMIEHYPQMHVISTIIPINATNCINYIDFFHPIEVLESYPQLAQAAQIAYLSTAEEDKKIALLMHEGRKELFHQGVNESGPFHPLMEAGLPSFYSFLNDKITAT